MHLSIILFEPFNDNKIVPLPLPPSDVPIWLEVMNRTKRAKQLVYAVRVKETTLTQNGNGSAVDDDPEMESGVSNMENNQRIVSSSRTFVKFRTGVSHLFVMRMRLVSLKCGDIDTKY